MHSQPLSIAITEWVDDSDSQSENKPCGKPQQAQRDENQAGNTLCDGYEASFEACFVDLGCLEKHNFSTALLENSRKHHGIAVNSHKALPRGPVSGLTVVGHRSVERFQSCYICSYDKTGCYYN